MKRFFAFVLAVLTVLGNVVGVCGEEENLIQLTDYRYENMEKSEKGFTFANISKCFNLLGTKPIHILADNYKNSVILCSDGTELFQQGKYHLDFYFSSFYECDDETGKYEERVFNYHYPQKYGYIIVQEPVTDLYGIIDENGKVVIDCKYKYLGLLNENYYFYKDADDIYGIYDMKNNRNIIRLLSLAEREDYSYIDYGVSMGKDDKYIIVYYDYGYSGSAYLHNEGYDYYSLEGKKLTDEEEESLAEEFGCKTYELHEYQSDNYFEGMFTVDENHMPIYSRADESYVIKEKKIGGKSYYALFKELKEGERAEDFMPEEEPSAWAKKDIEAATAEGLLFNNCNCRYKDNISRQDFCVLAVEAYCKALGCEIDELIEKKGIELDSGRFEDTENVYILLAEKLGIVSGTSATTFSPQRGIARQEAAVMLSNMSELLGIQPNSEKINFADKEKFPQWAEKAIERVSSIQNENGSAIMNGTDGKKFSPIATYSREQAYTTIYRLFKMCK